ncbi:kinase-like domain-containing protein [Lentinula aciculospora]|uniref:Kinase-like domain-containing protein n=1 Tax=Lentinula aciculospora TaxID=153920 RepID=A0A9W9A0R5_9AGAR|nr:kinase-like domain-containing protein [Lentinula aciculospora]
MSSPPRINTTSKRQATSEPCTPVDSSPTKHKHTDSDSVLPFLKSLTPPTEYHSLASSFSFSTQSLNSDRLHSAGISRGRGRSLHAQVHTSPPASRDTSVGSQDSTDTHGSWRKYFSPRLWKTTPSKRHAPVPKEQTDAYLRTQMRVKYAVKSIGEVARTGIEIVADTGELIPVPGLAAAAKLLASIWDALDEVGSNRLGCLRLAGRCADFLLAIYEEVHEMGDQVTAELAKPVKKLETSFNMILDLMVELKDQPFWKRWLDRDEIQADIERCHESLHDCLFLFNMSILTRILNNVSPSTNQSVEATPGVLWSGSQDTVHAGELDPVDLDDPAFSRLPRFASSPPAADDLAITDAERIRNRLRALQILQNKLDKAADINDLDALLSTALNAKSDHDMQNVLQVAGKDMLKAIRTLLGVLKERGVHWKPTPGSAMRSANLKLPHTRAFTWPLDERQGSVLDGEFIESDIARLAQRTDTDLPSWTIGKSDVAFQELIGRGFFSNVYKGTWRHRTVAIKVLEPTTQRDTFLSELNVWKSLNHPNILRLYGTSDPQPESFSPAFLISPYMRNGTLPGYLKRLEWGGDMNMGISMVSEVYGDSSAPDLLKFMLEIATAMEYMHSAHVVHGDFKGANVLLDNDLRCVVGDFGHSRHQSQISFKNPKHAHGLRWQSPELMSERSLISKENDVYAFAITCVEIVTMGSLPWPMIADDVVKDLVLKENARPPFPSRVVGRLGIRDILDRCWDDEVMERPTFSQVVKQLESLINGLSFYQVQSPVQAPSSNRPPGYRSPHLAPVQLPSMVSDEPGDVGYETPELLVTPASTVPSRSNTIKPHHAQ